MPNKYLLQSKHAQLHSYTATQLHSYTATQLHSYTPTCDPKSLFVFLYTYMYLARKWAAPSKSPPPPPPTTTTTTTRHIFGSKSRKPPRAVSQYFTELLNTVCNMPSDLIDIQFPPVTYRWFSVGQSAVPVKKTYSSSSSTWI